MIDSYYSGINITLSRISRLYKFRDLIIKMRRQGFLIKEDALKLADIIEEIINEISGGEAKLSLKMVYIFRTIILNPGKKINNYIYEKFNRLDVFPSPENLMGFLKKDFKFERSIINGHFARTIITRISNRRGYNPEVVNSILNIQPEDFISELGFLFENLLNMAENYAKILENHILNKGSQEIEITKETKSPLAEIIGRVWLEYIKGSPWKEIIPFHAKKFEFDAVSENSIGKSKEIYVAEIEVNSLKFLEIEKNNMTSIEGKTKRLKNLINSISKKYVNEPTVNNVCLRKFILIYFDKPSEEIINEIRMKVKEGLKQLYEKRILCDIETVENFELIDKDKLINEIQNQKDSKNKALYNRIMSVIELLIKTTN